MQNMMRDHFEGTPLDMTQDIGAGAFKLPYRWRPLTYKVDGKTYTHERAIATQQTGFSLVAQLRPHKPDYMKTILWFGVDDANTCVYVPFYNCTTTVPRQFAVGNGDLYNISWDAAFWVTNYVANQTYQRYSLMIDDVRKVQKSLEDSIAVDVAMLEREIAEFSPQIASTLLQDLSNIWSEKYVTQYKKLGDYLLVKYLDGNVKREKDGKFERSPYGMPVTPKFPGYNERYHRSIIDETGTRLQVKEPKVSQK
jgi:dipeptidase